MFSHGYLKKRDSLKRRPSEKEYVNNQHKSRSETFAPLNKNTHVKKTNETQLVYPKKPQTH